MTAVASRRNTSIVICHDGDFEYLQDYQNNSECDPILNNSRIKRLIANSMSTSLIFATVS